MRSEMMNSMLLIFALGITLSSLPSLAAGPRCSTVLTAKTYAPLTRESLDAAVDNLAKLRLELDMQKLDKSHMWIAMAKMLEQKFQDEFAALQTLAQDKYSPAEIKALIVKQMEIRQGLREEESVARQNEKDLDLFSDDFNLISKKIKERVQAYSPKKMTPLKPVLYYKKMMTYFRGKIRGATYLTNQQLEAKDKALATLAIALDSGLVHVEFQTDRGSALGETISTYVSDPEQRLIQAPFSAALGLTWYHREILHIRKCVITLTQQVKDVQNKDSDHYQERFVIYKAMLEAMGFDNVSVEGNVLLINDTKALKQTVFIPETTTAKKGDYALAKDPSAFQQERMVPRALYEPGYGDYLHAYKIAIALRDEVYKEEEIRFLGSSVNYERYEKLLLDYSK